MIGANGCTAHRPDADQPHTTHTETQRHRDTETDGNLVHAALCMHARPTPQASSSSATRAELRELDSLMVDILPPVALFEGDGVEPGPDERKMGAMLQEKAATGVEAGGVFSTRSARLRKTNGT